MKTCSICKKELSNEMFGKRKFGIKSVCIQCHKEYAKKWYLKNKSKHIKNVKKWAKSHRNDIEQKLIDYLLGHPCVICGNDDPLVLEFDHIDRNDKSFFVSRAFKNGHSWKSLRAEIEKCQVLCSNCHRKKTEIENKSWKIKYLARVV